MCFLEYATSIVAFYSCHLSTFTLSNSTDNYFIHFTSYFSRYHLYFIDFKYVDLMNVYLIIFAFISLIFTSFLCNFTSQLRRNDLQSSLTSFTFDDGLLKTFFEVFTELTNHVAYQVLVIFELLKQ